MNKPTSAKEVIAKLRLLQDQNLPLVFSDEQGNYYVIKNIVEELDDPAQELLGSITIQLEITED